MIDLRTYQDLQAVGQDEKARIAFIEDAIREHKDSYAPLDLKTDRRERQLTGFINRQEEMQTLMMAAPYADDEYITTKALTILGDADMVDDVLKCRAADDLGRFDGSNPQDGGNEPEEGGRIK